MLKVLEYLLANLPNLFERMDISHDLYPFLIETCRFNLNLCHNPPVVAKYIDDLKEISDCDIAISEFEEINELLKIVKLKGMNLVDSVIMNEMKNMEKLPDRAYYGLYHDSRIESLMECKKKD